VGTAIDYGIPGPFTDLAGIDCAAMADLHGGPVDICAPVRSLVVQPGDAEGLGLAAGRFATNQVRRADVLVRAVLALNPAPLKQPRPSDQRVVGTCRHFAVIACALLRRRGVPSRVRCGFATYFQPGQGLDHWVTEYWEPAEMRWVRLDAEVLGGDVLDHATDLRPEDFLSGGEAWTAYRRGRIDASRFGVYGTGNWGPAEIRGNAVKDLAALNKVEMLPWEEWGRMTAAYAGETGPDYDDLLDSLAEVCAADEPADIAQLYRHRDLEVPAQQLR
jgi:hypothetical protein